MKLTYWVGVFIFEIGVWFATLVNSVGEKSDASVMTWQNNIWVGLMLSSMFLIAFMAGRDSKSKPPVQE